MSSFLFILIPIAVLAVAGVLFLGIYNMAKGGSPERSNKLMQMRVLLQLVAIVIIMAALYFASRG
jgi:integral membrane sensor domain MASE1